MKTSLAGKRQEGDPIWSEAYTPVEEEEEIRIKQEILQDRALMKIGGICSWEDDLAAEVLQTKKRKMEASGTQKEDHNLW